jgi:hypothetical protein
MITKNIHISTKQLLLTHLRLIETDKTNRMITITSCVYAIMYIQWNLWGADNTNRDHIKQVTKYFYPITCDKACKNN